jgi:four helix bundle protein
MASASPRRFELLIRCEAQIAGQRQRRYGARVRGFDHERLDVYQVALDFVVLADRMSAALPRGRAYLVDQLRRAATSICLNIAEGAGEFAARDKARFYRMAQRSATESAAVLDIFRAIHAAPPAQLDMGRQLLLRMVAMLTTLARRRAETGHAAHADS